MISRFSLYHERLVQPIHLFLHKPYNNKPVSASKCDAWSMNLFRSLLRKYLYFWQNSSQKIVRISTHGVMLRLLLHIPTNPKNLKKDKPNLTHQKAFFLPLTIWHKLLCGQVHITTTNHVHGLFSLFFKKGNTCVVLVVIKNLSIFHFPVKR